MRTGVIVADLHGRSVLGIVGVGACAHRWLLVCCTSGSMGWMYGMGHHAHSMGMYSMGWMHSTDLVCSVTLPLGHH